MKRLDDQVLRSLGHVQAHTDAGDGSETIIHSLAHQDFGKLSERTKKLLAEMQRGEPFEAVMKREFDVARQRPRERGYSLLIAALAAESGDIETRLENITDEVMTRNAQAAQDHANKVKLLAYIALLIIMVAGFMPLGPIFIEAGAAISAANDPAAPDPKELAAAFDPGPIYLAALALIGILMAFMVRWR